MDDPADLRGARELAQVRATFELLERRGFRVIEERYDASAFGNIIVDFASDAAWIGLVRDRGQWDVAVARDASDERLSWTLWLESLGARDEAAGLADASSRLAPWAASVARHLARLLEALAPANYAETLAQVRRAADRKLRPWWRIW